MPACVFVQPAAPVLNCPLVVYERDGAPTVEAQHDGSPVFVQVVVKKSESVTLDVQEQTYDCGGHITSSEMKSLPYRRYELAVYGPELGDELIVDHVSRGPFLDGACAAETLVVHTCNVLPPSCSSTPSTAPDTTDSDPTTDENLSPYGDDMNCSAGGGAGSLVVAFSLLSVVRRRRK